MFFNRFDVLDAWYIYLSDNHRGQWSKEYKRLCKMLQYYQPARMLKRSRLNENAQAILERLEKQY